MGREIERKFLVNKMNLNSLTMGTKMRQGYLPTSGKTVVRIRITNQNAWLTIKGEDKGSGRPEFEYEIPVTDAEAILNELCQESVVEKTRYKIEYAGMIWEVDVFHGDNDGLVMAEVELESTNQKVELPPWLGAEVTGEPKYNNSSLVNNPFRSWE